MGNSTLVKDPEKYIRKWPDDLWPEIARRFYAYVLSKGLANNSIWTYLVSLKSYFSFLKARGLDPYNVDIDLINEFIALHRNKHNNSVTLKVFYKMLSRRNKRLKELYHEISIYRRKTTLPEVLSREEVFKLINNAINFELKVLIALLYETGARISEILGLRVKDIVFNDVGAKVIIRRSKSEPRTVPVIMFAKLLANYIESRNLHNEDLLFDKEYNTYRRWLKITCEKAGVKYRFRMFHIFRHTRATELYPYLREKGLMIILGWNVRR